MTTLLRIPVLAVMALAINALGAEPGAQPQRVVLERHDQSAVADKEIVIGTATLPPGSAIVIPRDVTPIDTRQLILDITGIMSQLAVSVASLAVIAHN